MFLPKLFIQTRRKGKQGVMKAKPRDHSEHTIDGSVIRYVTSWFVRGHLELHFTTATIGILDTRQELHTSEDSSILVSITPWVTIGSHGVEEPRDA